MSKKKKPAAKTKAKHSSPRSTPTARTDDVPLSMWRSLYEAAMRFREMAPWQWMDEMELIGIRNPLTEEHAYASVMGTLGEHLAMCMYLGDEGLSEFLWVTEIINASDSSSDTFRLLELPTIQASFEDREMLTPEDVAIIRSLGLSFRGKQAWPLFRHQIAGYMPWYLNQEQVQFLTRGLEQTMNVASRRREQGHLLRSYVEKGQYLMRVAHKEGDAWSWRDQAYTAETFPDDIYVEMSEDFVRVLKQAPRHRMIIEIDVSPLPFCLDQATEVRPKRHYQLFMVEATKGVALGSEIISVTIDWSALLMSLPEKIFSILLRTLRGIPMVWKVMNNRLAAMLQPICDDLNISLVYRERLPQLEAARDFILSRL